VLIVLPEYNLDGTSGVEKQVDSILSNRPEALKRVRDNRRFKKRIRVRRVVPKAENITVFGVKSVNVNAILKDNLWDRSIFTTDKLSRMFLNMTYEQLKKYIVKKRAVPMGMLWILMLLFGVGAVVLVVLFLLPSMGVI